MRLFKSIHFLLLTMLSFLIASNCFAQANENWNVRGEGVEKFGIGDATSYRFTRGFLDGSGTSFKNGIIEFELKPNQERAFFYIYFRKQSETESEVVYIRTHKSNAPDTVQYSPVYQGKSAWQLYYANRGTASATLPADAWTKIRMQVVGKRLSMWVGENPEPVIKEMALNGIDKAGGISFRGNIPRGSAAKHTAMLRNIRIEHLGADDFQSDLAVPTNPGAILTYKVSPAFAVASKTSVQIPKDILNQEWSAVSTNAYGVLELLRHRIIPKGTRAWAVVADARIVAERATQCQVDLGFSDTITLSLNGKKALFVDASYRYRENRQEGLMHSKQVSVFLNLKAGSNHIRAVVADSFGGWGLQTQLIDCSGVNVVQ